MTGHCFAHGRFDGIHCPECHGFTRPRSPLTDLRTRLTDRDVILLHVSEERDRQDAKWGGIPGIERRDDHTYAAVLTEEVGEVCRAWLERDTTGLREELVQVAAVAVAWIEELDNGGAKPRA